MKTISWSEWLDKHIPYYEAERFRKQYFRDPPCDVLILFPEDRINYQLTKQKLIYEMIDQEIKNCGTRTEALFLERDTRQEWYWAFWKKGQAFLFNFKLL